MQTTPAADNPIDGPPPTLWCNCTGGQPTPPDPWELHAMGADGCTHIPCGPERICWCDAYDVPHPVGDHQCVRAEPTPRPIRVRFVSGPEDGRKLTAGDRYELPGRGWVATFRGIEGLDPRTLTGSRIEINRRPFTVQGVETFAVPDATGTSFGLLVTPSEKPACR